MSSPFPPFPWNTLDAPLRDAVADLGYALDLADPGPLPGHARDEDMLARANSEAMRHALYRESIGFLLPDAAPASGARVLNSEGSPSCLP